MSDYISLDAAKKQNWGLMNEEILKENEALRQQFDDLRRKNDF